MSQCDIRMVMTLTVMLWLEMSGGLTNPNCPLYIKRRRRLNFFECDIFGEE